MPFTRDEIIKGEDVPPASVRVNHVDPPLTLNSYPVMAAPLSDPAENAIDNCAPAVGLLIDVIVGAAGAEAGVATRPDDVGDHPSPLDIRTSTE